MPEEPLPVEVANEEPLQVEVAASKPPKPVKTASGKAVLPPTTTEQEDIEAGEERDERTLVTRGQRLVNVIWEATQSVIAVSITFAIIATAMMQIETPAITNAFFLIIGFYFSRTNHSAVGGVGKKVPLGPYVGR